MFKLLLLILIPFYSLAQTEPNYVEFTYYGTSMHFQDHNVNEDHDMFGLEYRNNKQGVGVVTFKNSMNKQATAVMYARYWEPVPNVETSARLGLSTGYNNPLVGTLSVAYTKHDIIRPRLSWFGKGVLFSLSMKF